MRLSKLPMDSSIFAKPTQTKQTTKAQNPMGPLGACGEQCVCVGTNRVEGGRADGWREKEEEIGIILQSDSCSHLIRSNESRVKIKKREN